MRIRTGRITAFVLLIGATRLAWAEPARAPAGCCYPLDGITSQTQLVARVLSGGVWLSGLPGMPRYNGTNIHAGIDLRARLGDPIYAIADGVVDPYTGIHGGYGPGWTPGGVIIVRCAGANGMEYRLLYGHTQNHAVVPGQTVHAGELLGEIGPWLEQEGGPHLHVTVRIGQLPRYGWGTPTAKGQPTREGAECAGCAAEVVALGYRDPKQYFLGTVQRELQVGAGAPDDARDILMCRYGLGYPDAGAACPSGVRPDVCVNAIGLPEADPRFHAATVRRCGRGYAQTFRAPDGQFGALMLAPDGAEAHWVRGAIWSAYLAAGGLGKLGFPTGEERIADGRLVQEFERGKLTGGRATAPQIRSTPMCPRVQE